MPSDGPDSGSILLLFGAAGLILLMAWRGWRLGIVRQALSIVALAAGYVAGYLFGGFLIPVLRPIGFPDRVLTIFGAALVGLLVYIALMIVCGLLFKRTAQQSVGIVKLGFGASGALLGAIFGVFLVCVCVIAIRIIGTIADAETHPRRGAAPPSRIALRVAAMKHSLESGPVGTIIEKVDPIPGTVYQTLDKVGKLSASPDSIDRFAHDKEVNRVSVHPKIVALRDDPDVQRAIRENDYVSLLRNPKLIDAANDPEVMKLLGTFDLQKALDHALGK
jgi:uncharacterized membrane protein required for colicin V production